jgi:hypothetical protein
MKGTMHRCLGEMIVAHYGQETWRQSLIKAGLRPSTNFHVRDDVEETTWSTLLEKTAGVLGKRVGEVLDQFGHYWSGVYAPREYYYFYVGVPNAKRMLLKLDRIHGTVSQNFDQARPPQFAYEWLDDEKRRLKVRYQSDRHYMDMYISMARGTAAYYQEKLEVEKLSEHEVIFEFAYAGGLEFGRNPHQAQEAAKLSAGGVGPVDQS